MKKINIYAIILFLLAGCAQNTPESISGQTAENAAETIKEEPESREEEKGLDLKQLSNVFGLQQYEDGRIPVLKIKNFSPKTVLGAYYEMKVSETLSDEQAAELYASMLDQYELSVEELRNMTFTGDICHLTVPGSESFPMPVFNLEHEAIIQTMDQAMSLQMTKGKIWYVDGDSVCTQSFVNRNNILLTTDVSSRSSYSWPVDGIAARLPKLEGDLGFVYKKEENRLEFLRYNTAEEEAEAYLEALKDAGFVLQGQEDIVGVSLWQLLSDAGILIELQLNPYGNVLILRAEQIV